jgi:AraC family transcriptional regulator of arabinose operon
VKIIFSKPLVTPELSITAMGVQEALRSEVVHRPSGTNDYLFMLFYDRVELNLAGHFEPPRTLIVWGPEHAHLYGNRERRFRHTWLHCNGSAIAPMLRAQRIPLGEPIFDAEPAVAEHYFLALYRELTGPFQPEPLIAKNCLESFLCEVRRRKESGAAALRPPERLLKIKNYIEAHCEEAIRLADLAERAALTPQYLCSAFRRHFGVSPIELVIRQRMQRAEYLLQDQNLSVGEVGRRVGYEDIFQFSKQFKRQMGVSPSQLRKRLGAAP